MIRRIIPVLLIDNNKLVKTVNFKSPRYLGDPINAVKLFNGKEVDELAIIDISANDNGKLNFDLLYKIANQAFMPLAYGGGLNNIDDVKKIISLGYEKVIFNTAFHEDEELIKEAVKILGSSSVVISIDAKKTFLNNYYLYVNNGRINTKVEIADATKKAVNLGAGELIAHSIDADGSMSGYDSNLIKLVLDNSEIPVITCGGAGSIKDICNIFEKTNVNAAAAGSIFVYYGKHKAVLINIPKDDCLDKYLLDRNYNFEKLEKSEIL